MLIILSPAKTLDYETPATTNQYTQPYFVQESEVLANRLKEMSSEEIGGLMSISEELASLNQQRYQQWAPSFSTENSKQAVLAFQGDVYQGLEAETLSEEQLQYAQSHLRILSGLYGVLKPLDLMRPYRLEMGTKMPVGEHKNLYGFWGEKPTAVLNQALQEANTNVLLNLASQEYFKVVKKKQIAGNIVTPVFKDEKNGKLKVISFYAKKARGWMARYILENQIERLEDLQGFNTGGYAYQADLSDEQNLVFTR